VINGAVALISYKPGISYVYETYGYLIGRWGEIRVIFCHCRTFCEPSDRSEPELFAGAPTVPRSVKASKAIGDPQEIQSPSANPVRITQPLCPFPQKAMYVGGDPRVTASFTCS
jgi:hypothetical protein